MADKKPDPYLPVLERIAEAAERQAVALEKVAEEMTRLVKCSEYNQNNGFIIRGR